MAKTLEVTSPIMIWNLLTNGTHSPLTPEFTIQWSRTASGWAATLITAFLNLSFLRAVKGILMPPLHFDSFTLCLPDCKLNRIPAAGMEIASRKPLSVGPIFFLIKSEWSAGVPPWHNLNPKSFLNCPVWGRKRVTMYVLIHELRYHGELRV